VFVDAWWLREGIRWSWDLTAGAISLVCHWYVRTIISQSQFWCDFFWCFNIPKTLTRAFWLLTVKTMASQRRLLPLLLAAAICAPAFVGTRGTAPTTPSRIARRAENFIPLDAIEPAVTSYVTWQYLGHMFWKSWEFQNVEMITIPKDQPLPDR